MDPSLEREAVQGPARPDRLDRLDRLADKLEIADVLARYCRGVDRCDLDTLTSVYHPDATDDHGTFRGPAHEFAAWAVQGARQFWHSSHHSVHNVLVEWISEDAAHVESYVLGFNRRLSDPSHPPDDGVVEVFAGRYVDRFERRLGLWKIAHRQALRDVDTLLDRQRWAGRIPEGARFPDDPVYQQRPANHPDFPGP